MSRKQLAKNAVARPTPEPKEFQLSETQKEAVLSIIEKQELLEQQQSKFMQVQVQVAKRKSAVIAEIEASFGLQQGAINRGEWAIMGGAVVKQGK
jgi:hypothetical protein